MLNTVRAQVEWNKDTYCSYKEHVFFREKEVEILIEKEESWPKVYAIPIW